MAEPKTAQEELIEVEQALSSIALGGQSYTIGSRKLTRADYSALLARKKELQAAIASEGYVVSGPDIVSRGFVYVKENEELIESARQVALDALDKALEAGNRDWNTLKAKVRDALSDYIYQVTMRNPIILPIFLEV